MASPSSGVRGGCCRRSQVVDGLGHFLVDLNVATAHGETLGARAFHADAHDGGDATTRFGAMDSDMDGEFEAHVEAHYTAGTHQLEHSLLVLGIEPPVLAACMREVEQVGRVTGIKRAVGNLLDKVGQFEVHLFFVLQGQRVALAAQLDGEEGVRCVAFNLETKRQSFALWCRP